MSDTETKDRRNTLYETDFYVWTQEQARLLSERRFDDLDLENLVDEVQSVGSSEKREIRSRLVDLIAHLLKWKFQPGGRGSSWIETVFEQRQQIADSVASSPSLRKYQEDQISRAYRAARLAAAKETGIAFGTFPAECPFHPNEVLDFEFFPEDREFE
ncbi:MAG TPA: DUF29 domain-containing protein [Xanthobacteraceae bacterium]|jgi:hypothetical protein